MTYDQWLSLATVTAAALGWIVAIICSIGQMKAEREMVAARRALGHALIALRMAISVHSYRPVEDVSTDEVDTHLDCARHWAMHHPNVSEPINVSHNL